MAQKRIKRTDQEWFDLVNDCRTSGLKVKVWCEQHNVTAKALYYHIRQLRQKGFEIPQRAMGSTPQEKQEVVCLGIPDGISADVPVHPVMDAAGPAAIRIGFHGIRIEVSNHAGQDTITNTFRALLELC